MNDSEVEKIVQNDNQISKVKKKRHIVRWVLVTILVLLIAAVAWFFASITLFKPKDLGIEYTNADYESALQKTGVTISFNGMSTEELEDFKDNLDGKKLDINNYKWEFSDYEEKNFTLTPSEATALLNEIAPAFWWFDYLQVNILPDGTMEGSSRVDVARLKADLFSDIADKIPIPLPDEANIYSKGAISIKNNVLTATPEVFKVGATSLPEKYMSDESVDTITPYFERIYTVIPGLEIKSLTADASGNFVFDGIIPKTVKVTEK